MTRSLTRELAVLFLMGVVQQRRRGSRPQGVENGNVENGGSQPSSQESAQGGFLGFILVEPDVWSQGVENGNVENGSSQPRNLRRVGF